MKILHTSDWHLGKSLEGFTRLDEQKEFLEDLVKLVDEKKIDLIIIAGDIYDTSNPPASAEKLFYSSLKKLSNNGKRPIIVIAGNHDSHERLSAVYPLASELGIIILGTPKSVAEVCAYKYFSVADSGEGYLELELNNEHLVIITIPFPSESRLNEIISENSEQKIFQKNYSERIGDLLNELSKKYREDTINIMVGHFYLMGGEISDSERDIQLGGAYAVSSRHLPQNAQYIAMGHLHKPQRISGKVENAYYSGSPIQYSKSEIGYTKSVFIVDLEAGEKANVTKEYLRCYKPIEIWDVDSIEDAIIKCKNHSNENSFVYLNIKTNRPLLQSEIKEIYLSKKDIVALNTQVIESDHKISTYVEKTIIEEFEDFYLENKQVLPTMQIKNLFLQLLQEEDDNL